MNDIIKPIKKELKIPKETFLDRLMNYLRSKFIMY